IEVVLDVWDLKEGQDKYVFMEKMILDESISNVLVVCDPEYSEKADKRVAGVGTESQIISQEVYERTEQTKFIPIVCDFSEEGTPSLPKFLRNRIWIDFSSSEAVNKNWERLVRVLYGKPDKVKPELGSPPFYVLENSSAPSDPTISKYSVLRNAVLEGKPGLSGYRTEFLGSCLSLAEQFRVQSEPKYKVDGKRILEDCAKFKLVRNHLVNWMLLEGQHLPEEEMIDIYTELLENLLSVAARPIGISSWNETWFEAQQLAVYEIFLYGVACLLKCNALKVLNHVLTTNYVVPETMRTDQGHFRNFGVYNGHSELLQEALAPAGKRLLAPAGELVKIQADRSDIQFSQIMESELLVLMMSFISEDTYWYPNTLHYLSHNRPPMLFLRAAQRRGFAKLQAISGVRSAQELRDKVKAGQRAYSSNTWRDFRMGRSFWESMNMDNLDALN
ncbi:MAG: TIR domain-containing protein, partial [Taibaiella sp.]|nr:TIR domain-containing protein [Taibaiella sp.]